MVMLSYTLTTFLDHFFTEPVEGVELAKRSNGKDRIYRGYLCQR